jgi:hypothetical protein
VGSNCTVSFAVWPGLRVAGRLAAVSTKPVPVSVAELTVKGAVPVDLSVTDWVVTLFTTTLPKARLLVFNAKVGVVGFNCTANVFETLLADAVSVPVCADATTATIAVKLAFLELAEMLIDAGTVMAASSLVRLTLNPPAGAGAESDTEQLSFPAPV